MAPFPQTTLMAHQRHPGGRPSEYDPAFCQMVIEFMAQGYSLTAFAGSIRKSREAVYTWIRVHREFADAVTRARSARVAALEAKLLRSRKGAETTAAIFALKNAEPTEWRDLKHTSHVHSLKPSDLTDAQLNAIASGASPADAGVIEGDFSVVEPGSETG